MLQFDYKLNRLVLDRVKSISALGAHSAVKGLMGTFDAVNVRWLTYAKILPSTVLLTWATKGLFFFVCHTHTEGILITIDLSLSAIRNHFFPF